MLALLVDGDQTVPTGLPALLDRLGPEDVVERVCVRNWRSTKDQKEWREFCTEYGFRLIQRDPVATGKNAADIELAVIAVDLLHTQPKLDFCLVSGDTDFTPVIERIRRAGRRIEVVLPKDLVRGRARITRAQSTRGPSSAPAARGPSSAPAARSSRSARTPSAPRPSRASGPADGPARSSRKSAPSPAPSPQAKGMSEKELLDARNRFARAIRRSITELRSEGKHERGWVSVNRVGSALAAMGIKREEHGFAKSRSLNTVLEDLGFSTQQEETGAYLVTL